MQVSNENYHKSLHSALSDFNLSNIMKLLNVVKEGKCLKILNVVIHNMKESN